MSKLSPLTGIEIWTLHLIINNMNNKNIYIQTILTVVCLFMVFISYRQVNNNQSTKLSGFASVQSFSAAASSSAMLVTTSGVQILATSSAGFLRSYAILGITGNANRGNVYCKMDNDKPAILEQGIWLSTTSPDYEIRVDAGNRYTGGIRCIADANTLIRVTEYASKN